MTGMKFVSWAWEFVLTLGTLAKTLPTVQFLALLEHSSDDPLCLTRSGCPRYSRDHHAHAQSAVAAERVAARVLRKPIPSRLSHSRKGQKGSSLPLSAIYYAEKICGLSRVVKANAQVAANVALWLCSLLSVLPGR